jgi:aspartyl protease family protein
MHAPPTPPPADPKIRAAMWVGFWLLLMGLLGYIFQDYLDNTRNPNQQLQSQVGEGGVREVVLKRNKFGHYNLTGQLNGQEVEFLLDTGATDISVPASLAQRLGLKRLYEMEFYTANGVARGYGTEVREVRIGDIALHDLPASINPNVHDDIVLLGMSFLKKIEFTQRDDTLILRQYPRGR